MPNKPFPITVFTEFRSNNKTISTLIYYTIRPFISIKGNGKILRICLHPLQRVYNKILSSLYCLKVILLNKVTQQKMK